jgi:polyphosphate kinase 2 (PPK2 family)
VHREVPPKGHIGIFNRSHYEDVLVPRVHGLISDKQVKQRFDHIKEFEQLLHESGTAVLKFFLHISKEEQRERLEERIRDPEKQWKFSVGDLEERKLWDEYLAAFEEVISVTSLDHAPWYIVPANRKWYRDLMVADTVVSTLGEMKLKCPPPPKDIDFDKLTIT